MQATTHLQKVSCKHAIVTNWVPASLCWAGKQHRVKVKTVHACNLMHLAWGRLSVHRAVQQLIAVQHLSKLYNEQNIHTSLLPVFISSSVMGRRHCSGILNRSKSDGRTPSHLMSGVVRLLLSYDMFMEPACPPNKICVHHEHKQKAYWLAGQLLQVLKLGRLAKVVQ